MGRPQTFHPEPRAPIVVGLLATRYLAVRGIEADARGCRRFARGVDLLAARGRTGTLPNVVVLALGSNGAIGGAQIRRALRIIGASRVLGLVTPARVGSGPAEAMRSAARRLPHRVVLIDCMRFSRGPAGRLRATGCTSATSARGCSRATSAAGSRPSSLRARCMPPATAAAKACGRVRLLDVFVVRGSGRVSCARALARARGLAGITSWRYYDWRRSGRRPWSAIYVRADRRIIVATRRRSP